MLDASQKQQYQDLGYLVLPNFKDACEIQKLRRRAAEIVEEFDADAHRTIFTTDKQLDHVDQYFLNSANGVGCFFEQDAFSDNGELLVDKSLSINKIGHAMHRLDDVFAEFSNDAAITELAHDLGLIKPRIWQSMYIFKQPGIGGEVDWHQDATFFFTDPITVTTFWFALEDATEDNGCLRVEPGGHTGPLRERFRRHGETLSMDRIDTTSWPAVVDSVSLPVSAGTLVCFHGKLPHYSEANRSSLSRHAYTLHVTCESSEYSDQNWIQTPEP